MNSLRYYMLQKFFKDTSKRNISISSFRGFDLRKDAKFYYFTMTDQGYDLWLGTGLTITESINNSKVVTNCYNHTEYLNINKQLETMDTVDFIYKPKEFKEYKSISYIGGNRIESIYRFCDKEEAENLFKNRNEFRHCEIYGRENGSWKDMTAEFKGNLN